MLQDLAALTPPVIVAVAVLIGTWAIVRRELAPKRRRQAEAPAPSQGAPADEDRAAGPGRGLLFPTSAIYLDAASGYAVLRFDPSFVAGGGRSARREIAAMTRRMKMTTYAWAIG